MKIYDVLEYLLQNQASGGSGGDSDIVWARIPIMASDVSNGSDGVQNLLQPVHILDLCIPYYKTTGMCLYQSWEELLENTQDVNTRFQYYHGSSYDSILVDYAGLWLQNESDIAMVELAFVDNSHLSEGPLNPVEIFPLDDIPVSIDPEENMSLNFLIKFGDISFCLNVFYIQPA